MINIIEEWWIMMKNERGITLIEVLATIVIMSIVSISIFNLLNSTLKTNQVITEKTNLNREANLIVSTIQKQFYTNDEIAFENIDGIIYLKTDSKEIPLNDSYLNFIVLNIDGTSLANGASTSPIQTKNENFNIHFIISTPDNTDQFEFETLFYRK